MANRKLPNRAQRRQAEQKRKRLGIIMLLLAVPIIAGLIFLAMPKSPDKPSGPTFTKHGTLSFIDKESSQPIKTIDIEVKKDNYERAEGMMWRKSMEDTQGMLFIMDREEPQTFWMRNTYIPLDIIFVDANKTILNIRENAPPQTLDPQASIGNALYVVEVNGGYCAKYGVEAGDQIEFTY
jgi:uncharacterized membrane protein (UPF0127 family)